MIPILKQLLVLQHLSETENLIFLQCLKCDEWFNSPNKKTIRRCDKCKFKELHSKTGEPKEFLSKSDRDRMDIACRKYLKHSKHWNGEEKIPTIDGFNEGKSQGDIDEEVNL